VLPDDDPVVIPSWSIEELAAVNRLTDSAYRDLARVATTTAAGVVARLAIVSAYLMLNAEARAEALRRIDGDASDWVDVEAAVQLSLARRL